MEWISVEDRLPEEDLEILMFADVGEAIVGKLTDQGWISGNQFVSWDYIWNHDIKEITHWMPLPEPPQ